MDLGELGTFLRSRRDHLRPFDVGLRTGPRRRVPGLRRDEVATLADASTDYYTELEHGGAQPSEQMLAALSRALRLTADEHDYIHRLAGRLVPPTGGPAAHSRPDMLDLLDQLTTTPAQVMTDLHVVLARNRLAGALLGPAPTTTALEDSALFRWFTDPRARLLYPAEDHGYHSHVFVADLRAAAARRGRHDTESARLVAMVARRSTGFAELWARHDVALRRREVKRVLHPALGLVEVNCLNVSSEDGGQRLTWFSPAVGTGAGEQLEVLAAGDARS